MKKVEGYVWCDIHCCIHEDNDDPYDYGYVQTGEEPECDECDWCKLWIGASLSESNAPRLASSGR